MIRCLTSLWHAVGFIFMVHGTGDHLEDAMDSTAVQPHVQRSHHQPFDGRLLNTGHYLLAARHREVLRAYKQKYIDTGMFRYSTHIIFRNQPIIIRATFSPCSYKN